MELHNRKNLLTLIVVVINTCLFNPNLACAYLMPTTRGRSKPDQLLGQSQVFASNRGSGGVRCRCDEEKNDEEQNDAGENVNDSPSDAPGVSVDDLPTGEFTLRAPSPSSSEEEDEEESANASDIQHDSDSGLMTQDTEAAVFALTPMHGTNNLESFVAQEQVQQKHSVCQEAFDRQEQETPNRQHQQHRSVDRDFFDGQEQQQKQKSFGQDTFD